MAQRLSTYDFSKTSAITSTERMTYPWDEWFDGSIWQIEQSKDFMTHPLMMERIIRTRATARKAKLILRHEGRDGEPFGIIVFRRVDIPMPEFHPNGETTGPVEAITEPTQTVVTRSKRPVRPT